MNESSLTIPSIVRQAQYENMEAFVDIVQNDEDFLIRKHKKRKERIILEEAVEEQLDLAA
jgi:hypothetical protein